MHVATVTKTIPWGPMEVRPGAYYLEDHNAAELMWASRGYGGITLHPAEWPAVSPQDIADSTEILVSRVGGFGDLLWLNAIYQQLNAERDVRIIHCCFPRYAPVLLGFVDHVVAYPLHETDAPHHQTRIWLENIIEATPCTDGEHPCDRMAARFGLDPLPVKSAYTILPQESDKATAQWPRTGERRVAIQTGSSTGNKTYPHIPDVVELAHREGWEILLIGDPREKEATPPNVFDCTQRRMEIRESIAMAGQCDAIIAADSVFIHVAEALNIPCVGIFGPFDGKTYLQGHGWAMQGRLKCSPCHWHPRGTPFPPGRPCSTTGQCEAIAMIDPREVISKTRKFL